jgi:hypothetical protein
MTFVQHLDYPNGSSTVGNTGYSAGAGQVVVASGTGTVFGTPTTGSPLRITIASALVPATCTHYTCTGRSSDTLTGLTLLSGTDRNYQAGDTVEARVYAEDFNDAYNGLNAVLLVGASTSSLPNALVLTAGSNITLTPGSGTLTIAAAGGGGGGTPGGSSGQLQYNSGGTFGGAADISVGSSGQLNQAAIAAPGSPSNGDRWIDSTQSNESLQLGGMTTFSVRRIYAQNANVTITNSGSSSVISTSGASGGVSLAAGFLSAPNRTLHISVKGYVTTAASTPGNIEAFVKLGSNVVATSFSGGLATSKTTIGWQLDIDVTTKTRGSSGKLDCAGSLWSGTTSGTGAFSALSVQNATSAGSPVPGTQVSLDLTAAYTLDVQLNLTQSTNTVVVTNVSVDFAP